MEGFYVFLCCFFMLDVIQRVILSLIWLQPCFTLKLQKAFNKTRIFTHLFIEIANYPFNYEMLMHYVSFIF